MRHPSIDEVVALVDARLEVNRRSADAGVAKAARKTA
jgi:hypothetical protein